MVVVIKSKTTKKTSSCNLIFNYEQDGTDTKVQWCFESISVSLTLTSKWSKYNCTFWKKKIDTVRSPQLLNQKKPYKKEISSPSAVRYWWLIVKIWMLKLKLYVINFDWIIMNIWFKCKQKNLVTKLYHLPKLLTAKHKIFIVKISAQGSSCWLLPCEVDLRVNGLNLGEL